MAKTSKQQKKNDTAKWIVRTGVGVVLLVLIASAIMDRRSKTNAGITTGAWFNALQAATDDQKELLYSDQSQQVTGSSEITGGASGEGVACLFVVWHLSVVRDDDHLRR